MKKKEVKKGYELISKKSKKNKLKILGVFDNFIVARSSSEQDLIIDKSELKNYEIIIPKKKMYQYFFNIRGKSTPLGYNNIPYTYWSEKEDPNEVISQYKLGANYTYFGRLVVEGVEEI